MSFTFTRRTFANHGPTPVSFLAELLAWAKTAPDEIFAPLPNTLFPGDVMPMLKAKLSPNAPWQSLNHRKAALLDAGVIHAGYESDWNWKEGVDVTNKTSMANKTGQETGAWEVSFDSEQLGHTAMKPFAIARGIDTPDAFIAKMKADHALACEYYFRLIRVSSRWAGPWNKGWIVEHLSPQAVAEWQAFLAA